MPNEILTDMINSFDWYGKKFDWYEKKLTDMKKTVDWYGKNHISQTFLTDMGLTTPDVLSWNPHGRKSLTVGILPAVQYGIRLTLSNPRS